MGIGLRGTVRKTLKKKKKDCNRYLHGSISLGTCQMEMGPHGTSRRHPCPRSSPLPGGTCGETGHADVREEHLH